MELTSWSLHLICWGGSIFLVMLLKSELWNNLYSSIYIYTHLKL